MWAGRAAGGAGGPVGLPHLHLAGRLHVASFPSRRRRPPTVDVSSARHGASERREVSTTSPCVRPNDAVTTGIYKGLRFFQSLFRNPFNNSRSGRYDRQCVR